MAGVVEVDDVGVTQRDNGEATSVAWADLASVAILTTDLGPFLDDFFWRIEGRDGSVLNLPSEAADAAGLLDRLQRLPGFDNEAVIRASASVENAVFHCWP